MMCFYTVMHDTVEDQPKIPANYPAAPISQQFDMHDFFRRCVKFAYSLVNLTHHPASSRERRIIADLCGFFFFFLTTLFFWPRLTQWCHGWYFFLGSSSSSSLLCLCESSNCCLTQEEEEEEEEEMEELTPSHPAPFVMCLTSATSALSYRVTYCQ